MVWIQFKINSKVKLQVKEIFTTSVTEFNAVYRKSLLWNEITLKKRDMSLSCKRSHHIASKD